MAAIRDRDGEREHGHEHEYGHEHEHELDELTERVRELTGVPLDRWATAALLESVGVRDRDAEQRFAAGDVFGLASRVLHRSEALAREREREAPPRVGFAPQPLLTTQRVARLWSRGGFYFVPMLLQVAALVAFGYSQYAWLRFSTTQASISSLAVGLSFVAAGGFVQLIGYLGNLFENPGKHLLTRKVVYAVLIAGTLTALLIAALGYATMRVTAHPYKPGEAAHVAVYFLAAAAQAIPSAGLYMLRRYWAMTVCTLIALAIVWALRTWTSMTIFGTQAIALGAWWAIELIWLALVMRRRARASRGPMRLARLPDRRVLVRRAVPFLLYGTMYFGLILTDRLVAWSQGHHPLTIWFRTPYELGLDVALASVVPAFAYMEVTVERFAKLLERGATRYSIHDLAAHNARLQRFWLRQLATIVLLAAFGVAIAIGLIELLNSLGALGSLSRRVHQRSAQWAFFGGALGYGLLTFGLTNAVLLFGLERPGPVLASIAPAFVINIAVGLIVTRSGAPWFEAPIGLVAGCATFALLSTFAVWRTLRRADYWAYAAW